MVTFKRWFGPIHIALGLAVAVQFVLSPTYSSGRVWEVLSFVMAFGVVAALAFSLLRMWESRRSGESPGLGAMTMLASSGALFLLFWRLWLDWQFFDSVEMSDDSVRLAMWYGIDVLFVLVNVTVGLYLLRTVKQPDG